MGDCQNYGPSLGPYYNTGPNTGPNLGDPKKNHNFDNPPYRCVYIPPYSLGFQGLGILPPVMEIQMENEMENDKETTIEGLGRSGMLRDAKHLV